MVLLDQRMKQTSLAIEATWIRPLLSGSPFGKYFHDYHSRGSGNPQFAKDG